MSTAVPARVILRGNGVQSARFGQSMRLVISELTKVLATPIKPKTGSPIRQPGDCNIDAYMTWKPIVAYFLHGRFVGYSTTSVNRTVEKKEVTATGLRVDDSLAQAEQIYGRALTTSDAQDGSWFATTPQGTLDGFLTGTPSQDRTEPHIWTIEAGSVGCPALSP